MSYIDCWKSEQSSVERKGNEKRSSVTVSESSELEIEEVEIIRFQNADRLVDYSDQYDAMIVSVVSIYDTYLEGLFVRLTFPLLFSSIVSHLWCLVPSPMMGTEVHE